MNFPESKVILQWSNGTAGFSNWALKRQKHAFSNFICSQNTVLGVKIKTLNNSNLFQACSKTCNIRNVWLFRYDKHLEIINLTVYGSLLSTCSFQSQIFCLAQDVLLYKLSKFNFGLEYERWSHTDILINAVQKQSWSESINLLDLSMIYVSQ